MLFGFVYKIVQNLAAIDSSLDWSLLSYMRLHLLCHFPHYHDSVCASFPCVQRGPELFPRDEEGNMIYDDISYIETWKVSAVPYTALYVFALPSCT